MGCGAVSATHSAFKGGRVVSGIRVKCSWGGVIVLMLAGSWPSLAGAARPHDGGPLYVGDEVLVQYQPGAVLAKATRGLVTRRSLSDGRTELLALPALTDVAGAIAMLSRDPAVAHVEPNYLYFPSQGAPPLPTDTLFSQLWGLRNTGQANFNVEGPAGVIGGDLNLLPAWDPAGDGSFSRTGSSAVVVAIIDDAFQIDHPDLAANFVAGRNIPAGNDNVAPVGSDQGHGTMVAGALGARGNNAIGVAGSSWHSRLMPIKIGRNGDSGFSNADILAAIDWAGAHGAHLINASFGGPSRSAITADRIRALAAQGVLFIAAAGNDDANLDSSGISFPALYEVPNLLAVAATNRQDNIASFSMHGPLTTHVAAPGLQVVTTSVGNGYRDGVNSVAGTSFSAPYVSGIAALLRAHVTTDWREIKARLIESGTTPAGGGGVQRGNAGQRSIGGRVDAARALDMTPRPSLTIQRVRLLNDANQRLDPGESVQIEVTLRNDWRDATAVSATLQANPALVAVNGGAQAYGNIASGSSATRSFVATVADVDGHHSVDFALDIQASGSTGGYSARRHFIREIARLAPGDDRTQRFHTGLSETDRLYDEYHGWHVDVPQLSEDHTLIVRTSTPDNIDIDLLGRATTPPQYLITLNIDPTIPGAHHLFCTSGSAPDCNDPQTQVSGEQNGNEELRFVIGAGTPADVYHFTVVNFAQAEFPYRIWVELKAGRHPATPRPDPVLPGNGGGGSWTWGSLLLLALCAGRMRQRKSTRVTARPAQR
jgi:subtilisin family serine protease